MDQIDRAAKLASEWWAQRLMSGDKKAFGDVLRPLIEKDLREGGVCFLECDYDPHGHLLTAVRAAVDRECRGFLYSAQGILPYKHELEVTPNTLSPKEGYGNWTDDIPVPTT